MKFLILLFLISPLVDRGILREKRELADSSVGAGIVKYKPIIKKYANRYGVDWRLVVAQIVQESSFKEKAKSPVGARGLMQIMPGTAKELGKELDYSYILNKSEENIAAGIYYLSKNMKLFPQSNKADRAKFALASYNAGLGRVLDAQDITKEHDRVSMHKWSNVRGNLEKLRREDWELHLQVWPNGRPKHAYFYGSKETLGYVEEIWVRYEKYRRLL